MFEGFKKSEKAPVPELVEGEMFENFFYFIKISQNGE
jgi:hypothetical protein